MTLFVPREDVADRVTLEATQQSIEVVRVPEGELLIFIGEAREGFAERFEGTPLWRQTKSYNRPRYGVAGQALRAAAELGR